MWGNEELRFFFFFFFEQRRTEITKERSVDKGVLLFWKILEN